ncbi:hypothetical protein [Flocculibacter collagenilyticus]|uniref:hypothetical protein n=1 Tax=Flocculibacter collagenilyticus TaxID=2744479 RepID=UPI0018F5AAC2|nr:hypothetical protein [Flocculibacter collagenilyticus]
MQLCIGNTQLKQSQFEGDDSLKAIALSTLTFLYYQGLGVKENKDLAVKNWNEAVKRETLKLQGI